MSRRKLTPGALVTRTYIDEWLLPEDGDYCTEQYGIVLDRKGLKDDWSAGTDTVPVAVARRLTGIGRARAWDGVEGIDAMLALNDPAYTPSAPQAEDEQASTPTESRDVRSPTELDDAAVAFRTCWFPRDELRVMPFATLAEWAAAERAEHRVWAAQQAAADDRRHTAEAAARAAGYRNPKRGGCLRRDHVTLHASYPNVTLPLPSLVITLPHYTEAALREIAALVRRLTREENKQEK